jgi:hypothetical protein
MQSSTGLLNHMEATGHYRSRNAAWLRRGLVFVAMKEKVVFLAVPSDN